VRLLVVVPSRDGDVVTVADAVPDDEWRVAVCGQLAQQRLGTTIVKGEQLRLDPARPVLEAPFPVCDSPEAGEQQAG